MHGKYPQKTQMLNEVAEQRLANSIKIKIPPYHPPPSPPLTGTRPTPHQSKPLTKTPYKPALRQERVNTKQVGKKTLYIK